MAGIAGTVVHGRVECPAGAKLRGLMLGLAGIGAMLLRLHDPAAMPSVGLWPKGPGRSGG